MCFLLFRPLSSCPLWGDCPLPYCPQPCLCLRLFRPCLCKEDGIGARLVFHCAISRWVRHGAQSESPVPYRVSLRIFCTAGCQARPNKVQRFHHILRNEFCPQVCTLSLFFVPLFPLFISASCLRSLAFSFCNSSSVISSTALSPTSSR